MAHISLSAQRIKKQYGGVTALADGDLDVRGGEVVALLGANGSGKSTLGKIITGVAAPDGGTLNVDGATVDFRSPLDARRLGITAVYQELSLVPDMTVAENIWLGHEPRRWGDWGGGVDRRRTRAETQALLDLFAGTVQPSLTPDALVADLPPDERQIVEILKAISRDPRLVILDEATASLDSQQVDRLFNLVGEWKTDGLAIVFVSHRMEEIFRVADRASVLRSGETVASVGVAETSEAELVRQMIGETSPTKLAVGSPGTSTNGPVAEAPPETPRALAAVDEATASTIRLSVQNLRAGLLDGVDLTLRDGELLGLGGLRGQGQEELLLALFGALPFEGDISLAGEAVRFAHPREAMRAGVAYVPGDRASQGLLLSRSILENLHLPSWSRFGLPLDMRRAHSEANRVVDDLGLVMGGLHLPVSSLSGGNAQKVVLGKWLLRDPKLLLLDDPTKGVDVGAKAEFYRLLVELRAAGTAVLFYSSDDDELLHLCDRVLVLHDGRVRAELSGDGLTKSNLVAASVGAGA